MLSEKLKTFANIVHYYWGSPREQRLQHLSPASSRARCAHSRRQ